MQGLVKGTKLCLNTYFFAGWRSELAGCRSTLSMSKIKVKISETKYCSFYKTLGKTQDQINETFTTEECEMENLYP